MSERKAINKYYPPDYDPSQVVKKKRNRGGGVPDIKIRMMAPYSMRCLKCNEYIAQRRSFNARKEVTNEKYLSTKIVRFHISCPRCNNKITFKTNPQTAGYTPEEGAVRNFEAKVPKVKPQETEDELLDRLEKEEQENKKFQTLKDQRKKNPFWQKSESLKDGDGDVMANLEKKLHEQQHQQQLQDQLEELAFRSAQLEAQGGSDVVATEARQKLQEEMNLIRQTQRELEERDDEEAARLAFSKKQTRGISETKIADKVVDKKEVLSSVESEEVPKEIPKRKSVATSFVVSKKPKTMPVPSPVPSSAPPSVPTPAPAPAPITSVVGYSSSEEE